MEVFKPVNRQAPERDVWINVHIKEAILFTANNNINDG